MKPERKLLDALVPIYAATLDHSLKAACAWVMTEIANGQIDAVMDTEAIQEIIGRYSDMARWEVAATLAESLLDLIPTIYPITLADLHHTLELLHTYGPQGVNARVLLHTAVMQRHGLHEVISTDEGYDGIEDIIRLDPADLFQQQLAAQ